MSPNRRWVSFHFYIIIKEWEHWIKQLWTYALLPGWYDFHTEFAENEKINPKRSAIAYTGGFFFHCIRFIILFIIGSILIELCRVALLLPLLCWCWEIPMSVCVNQKAKEKQTYEEMKKKKQWYTNRVYERSRNVSHSFTPNEIICYTCRTIKRFVNVFYFYMYIYATNSKCQSLTVPCHTARCYAMKIGIWIHFKRKNDSQKKKIFALPYGRYVFMMRKSGDYFTIFIFVFVMVMYNTLC